MTGVQTCALPICALTINTTYPAGTIVCIPETDTYFLVTDTFTTGSDPKNLFFESEDYFIESSEQVKQWYLDSAKEILNNLINIVDYDNKYSHNLYLSRSQANKRYINSCEEWDIKYRVHDEYYDYPLDEIMHNKIGRAHV